MKKLLTIAFALFMSIAFAQTNPKSHEVKEYTKKDGTHVQAHRQTDPNKTQKDNYSTKGNKNPYTGKKGTKRAKK